MSAQEGYNLIYPFVVCKSNGGPYEDHAFVAGARFGDVARRCENHEPVIELYVDPESVRQYELLAMHHGYLMKSTPWDEYPEDWAWLSLVRNPTVVAGEIKASNTTEGGV